MVKVAGSSLDDDGPDRSGPRVVDPRQAEVDHRIANSIQLAAAMLKNEKRRIRDELAREALDRAAARLLAVSRMHHYLSRNDPDRPVDLARVVGSFGTDLEESYEVKLDLRIRDVHVPADVASQICIILNELTANAVKHGKPDGAAVTMIVRATQDALGNVFLMLRDDGAGLPGGVLPKRSNGLGMSIVTSIVERLDGRLCVMMPDGQPGAGFEIVLRPKPVRPARSDDGEAPR